MAIGEPFDQILAAARAGGGWAWRDLYREFAPRLAAYLAASGIDDVDDVVGDTFLAVVRNVGAFEGGEDAFRAWLFTIGRNRAVDVLRAKARRPLAAVTDDVLEEIGPTGDVEEDALAGLARSRVLAVVSSLTADQRDVLLLRILGGLTIEEVATAMDRRAGAVKMLQSRGLAALRREISTGAVTL